MEPCQFLFVTPASLKKNKLRNSINDDCTNRMAVKFEKKASET